MSGAPYCLSLEENSSLVIGEIEPPNLEYRSSLVFSGLLRIYVRMRGQCSWKEGRDTFDSSLSLMALGCFILIGICIVVRRVCKLS